MRLTELVQDPFEDLCDNEQQSRAEEEGRQAVIEVVTELHPPEQDDTRSEQARAEDD
jgi:hypothetical protein